MFFVVVLRQSRLGYLNRLAGKIDPLVYAGRDSHPPDESFGIENVVVVAGGYDESDDEARLLVRFEQREILGGAHLYGDGAQRVYDRRSKRHERQRRW